MTRSNHVSIFHIHEVNQETADSLQFFIPYRIYCQYRFLSLIESNILTITLIRCDSLWFLVTADPLVASHPLKPTMNQPFPQRLPVDGMVS